MIIPTNESFCKSSPTRLEAGTGGIAPLLFLKLVWGSPMASVPQIHGHLGRQRLGMAKWVEAEQGTDTMGWGFGI